MLEVLEKLSGALAAAVNHQDATIDQLLAIKQIAWLLRNTAGEASLIVSTGLSAGKVTPETRLAYTKYTGGIDAAWSALQLTASGMQLPPAISSAIAATKTAYFEPSYLALRDRLLNQIAAGEKTELNANQWTPVTVGRLGAAVAVAEAALDAAKDHAAHLYATAQRSLVTQLALLIGALALALGAQMIVARRVIKPLHTMRDAMLKVAAGDLAVDTGYATRKDESARWPAHWRPSSSRPPTRCGSKRRSASATPAPRRGSRRSRAMSASSRAWCARRSASSATLPARCGPPRPACRRSRARPTSASRSLKRLPARLR
jgi:HAMP domain-containing protein